MIRLLLRITLLSWLSFLCLIALTQWLSANTADRIGIISFLTINTERIFSYYLDYDTGILIEEPRDFTDNTDPTAPPQITQGIDHQSLRVGFRDEPIASYPLEPHFLWVEWYEFQETVLMISLDGDNTILSLVDVDDGDLQPYLILDNFRADLMDRSPDDNYLLLREIYSSFRMPRPPQQHRLLNLRTDEIIDLGTLNYAYWSPDSKKILLGKSEEGSFIVSAEIYDIDAGDVHLLPVTVSQEDVAYFVDNNATTENAIIWSRDSQSFMIFNRNNNALYHLSIDGEQIHVYNRRLMPHAWSPDGHYLLASGNRRDGLFIIDSQAHTLASLESNHSNNASLDDIAWSPNSRYLAVMSRTTGISQRFYLTLYGVDGQQHGAERVFGNDRLRFVFQNSLTWLD